MITTETVSTADTAKSFFDTVIDTVNWTNIYYLVFAVAMILLIWNAPKIIELWQKIQDRRKGITPVANQQATTTTSTGGNTGTTTTTATATTASASTGAQKQAPAPLTIKQRFAMLGYRLTALAVILFVIFILRGFSTGDWTLRGGLSGNAVAIATGSQPGTISFNRAQKNRNDFVIDSMQIQEDGKKWDVFGNLIHGKPGDKAIPKGSDQSQNPAGDPKYWAKSSSQAPSVGTIQLPTNGNKVLVGSDYVDLEAMRVLNARHKRDFPQ